MQNRKIATQKIDARFEQVRAKILANAACFVANGFVEANWRTYRGNSRPYKVLLRQTSVFRHGSMPSAGSGVGGWGGKGCPQLGQRFHCPYGFTHESNGRVQGPCGFPQGP